MRLSEFLHALDFGHETAERDEALGRMFVRTHDFVELVKGRPDLITGVKGSGKSALYLTLLDGRATPTSLHLVAAQNARGPLIFASTLPGDRASLTSEEYFQKRWTAHSIGLAANKLIDAHPGDQRVAALRDATLAADLLIETADESKMWERSGRGRFFGSAFSGVVESEPQGDPDLLMRRVMTELVDGLEALDEQIWVLYDRLDDILVYDPPRERAMLRGLLQAMVSLASLSNRLKVKTFLRHDILDRVTAEHPVRNIDHLSRLRIKWNSRAIMRLAAVRIASAPGAAGALGLPPLGRAHALTDAQVDEVWLRFIRVPSGFVGKGKPERSFHHLFAQTFDATREYNPRIVLGYLTFLAREQAALCQHEDPELPMDGQIISQSATSRAIVDLSTWRMESYLYTEFQHLKPHIQRLKGQPNSFAGAEALCQALGLDPATAAEVTTELRYCGLLDYDPGKDVYSIAKLYKASLQSKAGTLRPQPRGSDPHGSDPHGSDPDDRTPRGGGPEESDGSARTASAGADGAPSSTVTDSAQDARGAAGDTSGGTSSTVTPADVARLSRRFRTRGHP